MAPRWLVAHDFSRCADAALDLAAREASERGVELLLFHASMTPDVPYPAPWPEVETGYASVSELERSLAFEVAKAVESVAVRVRERFPALAVEVLLSRGPPADAILQAAKEHGAERVVMGTHGRTGLSHLLLGSVAERVLRGAEVPVLVVKAG